MSLQQDDTAPALKGLITVAKLKFELVHYTDSNGFEKPAVVIGTRKSTQKGTEVPRPDKGCANLAIISPLKGTSYVRTNIPQGEAGERRTFRRLGQNEAAVTELAGVQF